MGSASPSPTGRPESTLGGWFNQTGSAQTTGVSLWNGTNWQSLGSGIAGGSSPTGPTVQAIVVNNSQVFIGGDFSSVNGVKATNVAVYSGGAWHAVGGGTNGVVESLAVSGGYLYAGGSFSKAGGAGVGAPAARWKLGTRSPTTLAGPPLARSSARAV